MERHSNIVSTLLEPIQDVSLTRQNIYAVDNRLLSPIRQDIAQRTQEKKREEAAHRALIEKSYVESQARHAYRLAHPAYADGRIW